MAFYDNPQYHLFFDGATSEGNPGTGGCGAYWFKAPPEDKRGREQYHREEFKVSRRLGFVSNNAAEYSGLILGLRSILKEYPINKFDLVIHGDSELVLKQIKGDYQVHNPMIRIYYEIALGLLEQIKGNVALIHIPRNKNAVADGGFWGYSTSVQASRSWVFSNFKNRRRRVTQVKRKLLS